MSQFLVTLSETRQSVIGETHNNVVTIAMGNQMLRLNVAVSYDDNREASVSILYVESYFDTHWLEVILELSLREELESKVKEKLSNALNQPRVSGRI